jgi:type III restriction enzyme
VVDEYVKRKVSWRDSHPCELGPAMYVERAVERLYDAIGPNDAQGEPPPLPILNRWGELGRWAFHVCRDPRMLGRELEWLCQ